MKFSTALLAAAFALAPLPALAQTSNQVNLFGVVDKIDASTITVKPDDGNPPATFKFDPKLLVLQTRSVTLADIKSNDFIASAAVRKEDGKLHSTELRIFPEALRGQGEGQRPMNDPRNQLMTNAPVAGTAIVNGSNNIKVKLDSGDTDLILDPGVPVTRIEAIDKATIKPGAKVRVQGSKGADGAVANRVTLQ